MSVSWLDELASLPAFAGLSEPGRALLAQGAQRRALARSASVLHRGQPVSGAYVALRGRLRVFTVTPGGLEATLYFLDPGQTCVLALNCLFNDLLYPAWVQAESATLVAVIPGAVYRQLFATEPSIRDLTVTSLSQLAYRLMSELELVHASQHRQRLAHFILMNAASDGSLRMTQQQLANHLGTTREVVARLMGDFVSQGLVRTARGLVSIRDLFGLRRVLAPDPPDAQTGRSRRRDGPHR